MIRLSEIDPRALAREVCRWVVDHTERLVQHFGAPKINWIQPLEISELGMCAHELALYAQKGRPYCAEGPGEHIQVIAETLFAAAHPRVYNFRSPAWPWGREEGEPQTAIEVVLLAAAAREEIARGSEVYMYGLAALGGVSHDEIEELYSRGVFRLGAADARRWLGSRGVLVEMTEGPPPMMAEGVCGAPVLRLIKTSGES